MSSNLENAHSTTGTSTRHRDVSPTSGMCPICERDCTHLCEIGKSAFRGREVLYPSAEVFGTSTAASNKDYGLDWSDLQIMVEVRGAQGVQADPDHAIFPNVDVSTTVGGVPQKLPVLVAGLGSTDVAKNNWQGLAMGCAISGVTMTIGENICGMDPSSTYSGNQVTHSKDMEFRINTYRKFWDGQNGEIVVQTNVEDQRTGVDKYVLGELGVTVIERKWGQGAKAIGGEVRVDSIGKAEMLKSRGYVVLPDPEDDAVQRAFKEGVFKTFERHSRVGFPEERGFVEDVQWLRDQGAKRVFLKTGAYNPAVVAFTLKCASLAGIEALTFDGAGGGTGMSPVPMMQDCSTPTLYLLAQVLEGVRILSAKGKHVPDISIAGGIIDETQIFKAMAMSNLGDGHGPYVKAAAMARSPITACMKSDFFSELAATVGVPKKFAEQYGAKPETFFAALPELRDKYGDAVGKELPWSAVGLYTYFTDRIGVGLKQLLAGSRKWNLSLLERTDLASLTERCEDVTGIPMLHNMDKEAFEAILDF